MTFNHPSFSYYDDLNLPKFLFYNDL